MSKPWDVLRKSDTPPPMKSGTWKTSKGSTVSWHSNSAVPDEAYIDINGESRGFGSLSPTSLREIGEFLQDLADQLEGK